MSRLLVNPGTPHAWEITLKHGSNRLGRAEQNDFSINHPTVSSAHCEIIVSSAGVFLKDLGSTNGTFVNRAPVHEALLQPGQHVQLGSIDMVFESDAPAATTAPAAPHLPVSVRSTPGHAAAVTSDTSFCKFHPKTPARFLCPKCHLHFCDLCVATRPTSTGIKKTCRTCGSDVTPVHVTLSRPTHKGFFARLPGAFIYPFRGTGLLILICATIAFAALGFVSAGLISIFVKIVFYGFLFLFMQNIIHTTVADENEELGFPNAGDLFGPAFQLAGTIVASFGLAIGLLVARHYEVDVPGIAIILALILGCFYFPMAFLAVAMKDTVLAANPMIVIPAILKIPVEYLVAAILLMTVFGLRLLGNFLSEMAGVVSITTRDMSVFLMAAGLKIVWAFVSVYLLTINMRILGLLYLAKKDKLGWFSH